MRRRAETINLKPWPFATRPRVLIEHPDPDEALELASAIRDVGATVGVCRGPDATADPATRCPLHGLEPCVVVEGADLVVSALDLETDDGREVLRGLRLRYPGKPMVVLATVGETLELGDTLLGCVVLPVDAAPERVAAEVSGLLVPRAWSPAGA